MRVTIRDIAQELGMSPSTVSQALNQKGQLRIETRERVVAKAKEMGYFTAGDPFGVDRILSGRPVWFWPAGMSTWPPEGRLRGFPAAVWRGAEAAFAPFRTRLHLVVEEELRAGLPDEVAGLIITGGHVPETVGNLLRAGDRPTVIVGSHLDSSRSACSVDSDTVEGVRSAVQHLHALGHRRIGFLNGPVSWRSSDQKWTGFLRGMHDCGLPPTWVASTPDPWSEDVAAQVSTLLTGPWGGVTAVICAYEMIGLSVVRSARILGLSVPEDLSVVTYHDEGASEQCDPPLDTVRLPVVQMGKLAAMLVVSAGRNNEVVGTRVIVPPSLIVRRSTGPPRAEADGSQRASVGQQGESVVS